MGFRQGAYARVWQIYDLTNGATIRYKNGGSKKYPPSNYSIAQMNISRKNKTTGEYDVDFQSNYVRLVGEAHQKARRLNVGDKGVTIKIESCDVSNRYDPQKGQQFTNFTVFDFSLPDESPRGGQSRSSYNRNGQNQSKRYSQSGYQQNNDSFMEIPDSVDDEELPFN